MEKNYQTFLQLFRLVHKAQVRSLCVCVWRTVEENQMKYQRDTAFGHFAGSKNVFALGKLFQARSEIRHVYVYAAWNCVRNEQKIVGLNRVELWRVFRWYMNVRVEMQELVGTSIRLTWKHCICALAFWNNLKCMGLFKCALQDTKVRIKKLMSQSHKQVLKKMYRKNLLISYFDYFYQVPYHLRSFCVFNTSLLGHHLP